MGADKPRRIAMTVCDACHRDFSTGPAQLPDPPHDVRCPYCGRWLPLRDCVNHGPRVSLIPAWKLPGRWRLERIT